MDWEDECDLDHEYNQWESFNVKDKTRYEASREFFTLRVSFWNDIYNN